MKRLGIFCAGNLGKEICDIAERINENENRWSEIFFVDNYSNNQFFYGKLVYRLEDLHRNKDSIEYIIANGEPAIRKEIYDQIKKEDGRLATIIDPTVIVSKTAILGEGIIATPYTTISSNVCIQDNVLLQSYICIGHDIKIGANSVISANTSIGGRTCIGENVFIGMGAIVKEELIIEDNVILGMGSVLYSNLSTGTVALGNPARLTKGNEEKRVFTNTNVRSNNEEKSIGKHINSEL